MLVRSDSFHVMLVSTKQSNGGSPAQVNIQCAYYYIVFDLPELKFSFLAMLVHSESLNVFLL